MKYLILIQPAIPQIEVFKIEFNNYFILNVISFEGWV